jgi:hypothetical protein
VVIKIADSRFSNNTNMKNRFLTSFGMAIFSEVKMRCGGVAAASHPHWQTISVMPSRRSGEVSQLDNIFKTLQLK